MPWRGHHATICKNCGGHVDEVGPLSARYKCYACGKENMLSNHAQLLAHNGPWWNHYRRRSLAALGVVVDTDD